MRVLVACVAESNAHFAARVETLLLSLRGLGGALANAPFVVNVVGQADSGFTARVEALGGQIRAVNRFLDDPRRIAGPSNKLRMLELVREEQFDVLLAVDCDVAFAGDPTEHISRDLTAAAVPDIDPLTEAEWQRLFAALELEPGPRLLEATMGARVYEYFNSGVVAVPADLCETLLERWASAVEELLALYRDRPDVVPEGRQYFLDQFALMKALRMGIPHRQLSSALNFPTHVRVSSQAALASEPVLLHYHGELDERGFLLAPRSRIARPAAERVNVARAKALGLPYAGLGARPARERLARRSEEVREAVAGQGWYESAPARGARGAARWVRATSSRSRAR